MYREFLQYILDFGHGVFCLTMLTDKKSRSALRVYIHRNSHLFEITKGTHGDIALYKLTRDAIKKLGLKTGKITKAESYESLLDIALVNSFLYEKNIKATWSNSPILQIDTEYGTFGILSRKWGIPKNIEKLDFLLAISHFADKVRCNEENLRHLSASSKKKLTSTYTPLALRNLRKTL